MKENADKARALDAAELAKQLREAEEQNFRLRFQLSMGQTDGLKKIRQLRKDRARILTVLRERELGKSEAPAPTAKSAAAKKAAVKKAPVKKVAAKAKPAAAKKAAAPKASGKKAAGATPVKG
jgi:large subunit ribosomal protein L29